MIGEGALFTSHREQLAALAAHHGAPTIYKGREFVAASGLMSYGSDVRDSYRWAGIYTSRVLKGEKPADLPVQQATKVELFINLKTAHALDFTVPLPVSGRADEISVRLWQVPEPVAARTHSNRKFLSGFLRREVAE